MNILVRTIGEIEPKHLSQVVSAGEIKKDIEQIQVKSRWLSTTQL